MTEKTEKLKEMIVALKEVTDAFNKKQKVPKFESEEQAVDMMSFSGITSAITRGIKRDYSKFHYLTSRLPLYSLSLVLLYTLILAIKSSNILSSPFKF